MPSYSKMDRWIDGWMGCGCVAFPWLDMWSGVVVYGRSLVRGESDGLPLAIFVWAFGGEGNSGEGCC